MQNKKAILFLFLFAWAFPEVLSGNTSPILLIAKPSAWFFGAMAYGIPLLFLHELSVRYNLTPRRILTLGLAYGFLNEGILAKTLTNTTNCCGVDFHGYGTIFGFHLGLALMLVPWHAIFSVLFPLLLMTAIFPASSGKPWFGQRGLNILKILVSLLWLAYFAFPNIDRTRPAIGYFILYSLLAAVFFWLALRGTKKAHTSPVAENKNLSNSFAACHPASLGAVVAVLMIFTYSAHTSGLPFALYGMLIVFAAWLVAHTARHWKARPEWFRFTLGAYITFSLFMGTIFMFQNPANGLIQMAVAAIASIWFAHLLKKEVDEVSL